MRHPRPRLSRRRAVRAVSWPWLGAALLVLCAGACSQPATEPRGALAPGEWRTFEGSWALTTIFCLLVFLLVGTPWLFLVVR